MFRNKFYFFQFQASTNGAVEVKSNSQLYNVPNEIDISSSLQKLQEIVSQLQITEDQLAQSGLQNYSRYFEVKK